jgi:hypothetical protein
MELTAKGLLVLSSKMRSEGHSLDVGEVIIL